MFSLQTIFGSGKQFYTLLDEAAVAASDAAKALHSMLRDADRQPALDAFKLARLRERAASDKISQALVDSFMTPIEREDIEAIAIRWPPPTWNTSTSRRARRCWSRPLA
jgi:hypothetical protein